MIEITRYRAELALTWNKFVGGCKNSTFLHDRSYMDYHADRFEDFSLIAVEGGNWLAVLPANKSENSVVSHAGLTYGGLLCSAEVTTRQVLEVFDGILAQARMSGATSLIYKPVPTFYHTAPADEDRYAMFRLKGELFRCDPASVVELSNPAPIQQRRCRGAKKAAKLGVNIGESADVEGFWEMLAHNLQERFGIAPTHSVEELVLLTGRFPDKIKLYTASLKGHLCAGVMLYVTPTVAHAQYIASTDAGRDSGALDALFIWLLSRYAQKRFFDFGISSMDGGRKLNTGLLEFKEGLGARTRVHEHFRIAL
jgi:hypothetical protein